MFNFHLYPTLTKLMAAVNKNLRYLLVGFHSLDNSSMLPNMQPVKYEYGLTSSCLQYSAYLLIHISTWRTEIKYVQDCYQRKRIRPEQHEWLQRKLHCVRTSLNNMTSNKIWHGSKQGLTIRPPKTPSIEILVQLSKYVLTENFDFAKSPIDATIIIRK